MSQPLDGDAVLPTDPQSGELRSTAVRMRASDADRQATVRVLQDGIARGLLSPVEGSERMGTAFATVFRTDLEPLTADLPPVAVSGVSAWGPPLTLFGDQLRSSLRGAGSSNSRAAQLGAVLLLLVVLLIVGTAMTHLLLDGGHGPGDGPHRG